MQTARATITGFEAMQMFKGQFTWWIDAIGGGTQAPACSAFSVSPRRDQAFTRRNQIFATVPFF